MAFRENDVTYLTLGLVIECVQQAGTIGARTGSAVIEDLCAAGYGERIELQRRVLFESTDAGIADEGHACPPFRPAIILSDLPLAIQHFRTESG